MALSPETKKKLLAKAEAKTAERQRFNSDSVVVNKMSVTSSGDFPQISYYGPYMVDFCKVIFTEHNVSANSLAQRFNMPLQTVMSWLRYLALCGFIGYDFDVLRPQVDWDSLSSALDVVRMYAGLKMVAEFENCIYPFDTYTVVDVVKYVSSLGYSVAASDVARRFHVSEKRAERLLESSYGCCITNKDSFGNRYITRDNSVIFKAAEVLHMDDYAYTLTLNADYFKLFLPDVHSFPDYKWDGWPSKKAYDAIAIKNNLHLSSSDSRFFFGRAVKAVMSCDVKKMESLRKTMREQGSSGFNQLISDLKRCGVLADYKKDYYVRPKMSYQECLDWLNRVIDGSEANTSSFNPVANISTYDNGIAFEQYCKTLLLKNGFNHVEDTAVSGDHGVDLIAEKDGIRYAIQCKHYSGNVGNKAVQEAHSGQGIYDADIAVVMTNSHFTPQAIEDAKKLRVRLWDGDYIASMAR